MINEPTLLIYISKNSPVTEISKIVDYFAFAAETTSNPKPIIDVVTDNDQPVMHITPSISLEKLRSSELNYDVFVFSGNMNSLKNNPLPSITYRWMICIDHGNAKAFKKSLYYKMAESCTYLEYVTHKRNEQVQKGQFFVKKVVAELYSINMDNYELFTSDNEPSAVRFRRHNDELIHKLQDWIDNNIRNKLLVSDLTAHVTISERHLKRRFKAATGANPIQYLQQLKVETAKEMLKSTNMTFEDICWNVGYENIGYFRKIFKSRTLMTPTEYRHITNV